MAVPSVQPKPNGEPSGDAGALFRSILFGPGQQRDRVVKAEVPPFFRDLNLDQVIAAVTAGREEYDLLPFFHAPTRDPATIHFRQEVFRDLEEPSLLAAVRAFAQRLRESRGRFELSKELHYRYQQERWFLDAVAGYCRGVRQLLHELVEARPQSTGLSAFLDYLFSYTTSEAFTSLLADTEQLETDLGQVSCADRSRYFSCSWRS